MKKVLLCIILIISTMCSLAFAASFSDLSSEHWAYEPIIEMANKGILSGYPDGTFMPDKSITRAEFAKIIVLALNLKNQDANIDFKDVPNNHWAYNYVQTASKYLSAYRSDDNTFMYKPDDKAVREDVAVAMVIAAGLENSNYDLKTLDKFTDKKEISESFRKYIAIAVENGLMRGHDNGTFGPKGYLTRAQVSQLVRNSEDVKEKVVINDKENNNFNVTFDTKTLTIDLGEDWSKYQYTTTNGVKTIYTPTQRNLTYKDNTAYAYDKTKKETKSNSYKVFNGKEKVEFKVMMKDDNSKFTTLQIRDPFYVKIHADEVYTEASTGKKSVEEVVSATNKLVKAEYKIDSGSWETDTKAINEKVAHIIVDVEKYNDGKTHVFNIRLTDEYKNVWEDYTNFKFEKEKEKEEEEEKEFADIKFDSKTLQIDLGENWNKYKYTSTNGSKNIYVPAQRYLTYDDNTAYEYNKTTKEEKSNSYKMFEGKEKITFKIMLKDNNKKYTTLDLRDPFYVMSSAKKVYTEASTGKKSVEEIVSATNKLIKAEYKIDNGSWVTDTKAINNKTAHVIVDVESLFDYNMHVFTIRLTDEYNNVWVGFENFRFESESTDSFEDIVFDDWTYNLDLGENWQNYYYYNTKRSNVIYKPSQRVITYKENTGYAVGKNGIPDSSNSYNLFNGDKNMTLRVVMANDKKTYKDIKINNPFIITIYNEIGTRGCFDVEIKESYNPINAIMYQIGDSIENNKWIMVDDWGTKNRPTSKADFSIDVPEKYFDGKTHIFAIRVQNNYGAMSNIESVNFKYSSKDGETLEDIEFDDWTYKLSLGGDWKNFYYCSTDRPNVIYKPTQRELTYMPNTAYARGKNGEPDSSNSYDMFYNKEKITLRVMLASNTKIYKDIEISKPFIINISDYDDKNGCIDVTVKESYNPITNIQYIIGDNAESGKWTNVTEYTQNKKQEKSFSIEVPEELKDGKMHVFAVRVQSTYGAVSNVEITNFNT